jgi:hypothetical protein
MTGREILDWLENNTLEEFEAMEGNYHIKGRVIPIDFRTNFIVCTSRYLERINPEYPSGDMLSSNLTRTYNTNPTTLRTLMERLELRMKPKCKNRRINDR